MIYYLYIFFLFCFIATSLDFNIPFKFELRYIVLFPSFFICLLINIKSKKKLFKKKIKVFLIFFISGPLLSLFFSNYPFYSASIMKFIALLIVIFCHYTFIYKILIKKDVEKFFRVSYILNNFFIGLILLSIFGLIPMSIHGIKSTIFGNPNGLSFILAFTITGTLFYYLRTKNPKYLFLIIINTLFIFIGSGRGTIVGLFLSYFFNLIVNGNLKIKKIFLKYILIIPLLFLVFQSSIIKTYVIKYALELQFDEKVKIEDYEFFERLIATRVGNDFITPYIEQNKSNFYFGQGFGVSVDILTGEISDKSGIEKGSSIISIYNETGFIGIILYIVLVYKLITNINFSKKILNDKKLLYTIAPVAIISFAMIIESFVSSWLYSIMGPGFNILMYNIIGFYLLSNNEGLLKN